MRRYLQIAFSIAAGLLCLAIYTEIHAADFNNNTVQIIRGPDSRPCTFFLLNNVYPADPLTPNSGWFVLRQNSIGYKENLALLLTAKLSGRTVNISTTGTIVPECGQVEAYVVMLN